MCKGELINYHYFHDMYWGLMSHPVHFMET